MLDDRERQFSSLDPDFALASEETSNSLEYKACYSPLLPTYNDDSEQIQPNSLNIQRVLRVLGFRPPHRSFLLKVNVEEYIQLRRNLLHGIVASHPSIFNSLKNFCGTPERIMSPSELSLMKGSVSQFFRTTRRQLYTAGFAIISEIFAPASTTEDNNWTTRRDFGIVGHLGKRIERFFTFWEDKCPSLTDIENDTLTSQHFQCWGSIRNTENESSVEFGKISRLMHTVYTATTFLEDGKEQERKLEILRTRCFLEVATM